MSFHPMRLTPEQWVATATSLYIAHALVTNSSDPDSLSSLLDVFDFHIIPTPNPDGYDYTWESDRYWSVLLPLPSATLTPPLGTRRARNWAHLKNAWDWT